MMRRREFITLLGGAAAWPLVAGAQQPRLPVIGYLNGGSAEPRAPMTAAFREGLAEAGYVESQNVAMEFRWAEGRADRLPALAAELVRRQVAVLVAAGGDASPKAAKAATDRIPIVSTSGGDPIATGLVRSLARPEANLTGVTFFTTALGPKRLELLRELVPSAAAIAMLVHPGSPGDATEVASAARALGLPVRTLHAASDGDIDAAFRTLGQERTDALLVISNPLFTDRREQIVTLANHYRLPSVYALREYATAGGLMSYGASIKDAYRQTGVYAGRILKGAKPGDLPIMQPTKFELLINLKTAKALGLTVSPTLLARADEVIE
jgi:putative ABC transport system substrate-binding protein